MTMTDPEDELALAFAAACCSWPGSRCPDAPRTAVPDDGSILRIGWAQDPQTLNPFVGQDEEAYNVWALNWDLLVNFDPEDLSPAPGIAESWEVSEDRKTVTFQLDPDASLVRRRADHVGGRQVVARGRSATRASCSPATRARHLDRDARRRDGRHRDQAARRPHHRRPLRLHPPRAHLGRGAARRADRHLPARAAAGRQRSLHRHRVRARAHHPDGAQPGVARATRPPSTRSNTSSTEPRTPSSARSQLGEIDMVIEVEASTFERLGEEPRHRDGRAPSPSLHRSSRSTSAPRSSAPTPSSIRRSRSSRCARRSPTRSTASASTRSRPAAPRSSPTGSCPRFYKSFYTEPEQTYPLRPGAAPTRSSTTPAG